MNGTTDPLSKMLPEVRALTDTFSTAPGVFAYKQNDADEGYEVVPIGQEHRPLQLDDVIQRIANEINDRILPDGETPNRSSRKSRLSPSRHWRRTRSPRVNRPPFDQPSRVPTRDHQRKAA